VGWLSRDHSFPTATPSESLVSSLANLVSAPVNLYRGIHLCEFCPPPPEKLSPGGIPMLDPPPGTFGNGEIRVCGEDGITFVAPVLVLHYVTVHQYAPPAAFVRAAKSAQARPNNSLVRTREE
jgi:hypothetical protein